MSKLEQLIKKYCPDGVEYDTLEHLGSFVSGLSGKAKTDFINGNKKFITYKNVFSNLSIDLDVDDTVKIEEGEKQHTLEYGDVIFTGSSEIQEETGYTSVLTTQTNEELYLNSFCFIFRFNSENIDKILPDFSKYLFRSAEMRSKIVRCALGVTRYNLSKNMLKGVEIPIVPLPIQEEIVRILDSYTEIESELEIKLADELEMRKKQYEYYRDKILSLEDYDGEVKEVSLGDVYEFKYGTGNNIPTDGGDYPVYGGNGICGYHDEYNSEDAPVIGHIGAYAGLVKWASGKHFVTYNGVICKHKNNEIDKRYAFYLLMIQDFLSEQKGSQPFVSYDALKKPIVKVPVDIKAQKRIAETLDKFSALTEDISEGLPAEIEMRHKQYEYYRDKLLSFNKLEAV